MIFLNQEKKEKCYRCLDAKVLPMSVGWTAAKREEKKEIYWIKKNIKKTLFFRTN